MEGLVKIAAVGARREGLAYDEYCEEIYDDLDHAKLISHFGMPISDSTVKHVKCTDVQKGIYNIELVCQTSETSYNFIILFRFGTYNGTEQVVVEIKSDNYDVTPARDCLEKIKICINNSIKKDWEKIIWLYDKDSECLSDDLYPIIYKTENLFRQLISEIMMKNYGANWWDSFITDEISKKHKRRVKGYKSIAPSFTNVDERLMSIDVSDLLSIATRKIVKWKPEYSEKINKIVNSQIEMNVDVVIEELKKQTTVQYDLWECFFSKYLPGDFIEKYKGFESNRNHVMHNKLLDRNAYKIIKESAESIYNDEKNALLIVDCIKSEEETEMIEDLEAEELSLLEEAYKNNAQEEAGVNIFDYDGISNILFSGIISFREMVLEDLRFRQDIQVEESTLEKKADEGELFLIKSCLNNEELEFKYEKVICDEEGAESTVTIYTEGFSKTITFQNGKIEYDDIQGYYIPLVKDGIDNNALEDGAQEIVALINTFFESIKTDISQKIDDENIESMKECGLPVLADDIFCAECGELGIYIGNQVLKFGQCPNCGSINDIKVCSSCGCLYNADFLGNEYLCHDCLYEYDEI